MRLAGRGRNRRRNEDEGEQATREQEKENVGGQPPSYTASHRERCKVRYTEVKKRKKPRRKR